MKNNKGFTLVELIAVVVVLAIIALIAVPAVSNYLYDAEDSYYSATESSLLASARDYFSDYHTLLPKNDGDVRELPIQELVDDGYIEEIKNNEDQKCDGTVYVKRLGNRDYSYCIVLKCADKVKKNTCTGGEEEDSGLKEYAILHKDSITVPQCTTYQEMLADVEEVYKHSNKLVGKIVKSGTEIPLQNNGQDILVYPDESTLNLNAVGAYKLNYEYSGAQSVKTNIHVNDVEKPNVSNFKITFTLGSKDGTAYECDSDTCPWVNQNVVIKFVGTDITTLHNCGKPGSGITQFFYKLDGITASGATLKTDYRPVTGYSIGNGKFAGYVKVPENEFSGKIYYNVVDKSGNYAYEIGSEPYRYLKIDTIKPTITIKGLRQDNNNEVASGTWVNSKLKFTFTVTSGISGYKSYYCKDNNNTCTPSASSTLINSNAMSRDDVEDYYIRYITISNAGTNSDIHSYNGKVDLSAPTCSNSGGVSTWVNRSITITGTCADPGSYQSGCTGNATKSWSANGTNLTNQSPGTVCDGANNCTTCASNQTVMIDIGAPSCGTNNGTTTWGTGTRNVTVNCNDDYSGCTNSYYTNGFGGNTQYGNITIADNAGNTNSCSVPVYLDNTAPTASHSSDVWGAKITCSDSGGSGLRSGGASITFSYSADSAFIETTCRDNAGNSKYASKTYYHKYKGDIRCYHWSCSGVGGTVSGSQCVKDPTYSGTCTCWQQELTNGAYFWVSSFVDFSNLGTSDCNVACMNKAYHHGTGTLSAGCGSWTLDGSTCKTDAKRVDEWQVCTKDNYGAPYQACPHIYADDTCEAYWE